MSGYEPNATAVTPRRPLRVLYVMHNAAPGGAARSLLGLLQSLPPGSVEATVLAPEGYAGPRFAAAGFPLRRIPAVAMFQSIAGVPLRGLRLIDLVRTAWHTRHGAVLRDAIRETRPDIVHLNDRGMLHAAAVSRRMGVPVVMHARCVADRRTMWAHALTIRALRRLADRVIAIDASVLCSLRELEHCEIVYNPVMPGTRPAVRAERDARRVRFVFLGNLAAYKGVWDLLACAELLRAREDILFSIAGGNTRPQSFYGSAAGRLAGALGLAQDVAAAGRRWVAERDLNERVEFLGHVDDIDELLSRTDVNVFPSHLNGPGRSVFEAGVAGIPSIVALADRVDDVVQDGITGLVVPERDPAALAAAVTRLADDAALRRRLGAAAGERYRVQFDPRRIGQQMLELYGAVLRRRARALATPAASVA